MKPKELRERAQQEDAAVEAAIKAGDNAAALVALARAGLLRKVADELEATAQEQARGHTVDHRAAISRSMRDDSAPMRAAAKAGYPSVRAVAKALGKDATFVSRVLRGAKPMPADLAAAFERLTGYPASRWRR